jgi:hypothetical protein
MSRPNQSRIFQRGRGGEGRRCCGGCCCGSGRYRRSRSRRRRRGAGGNGTNKNGKQAMATTPPHPSCYRRNFRFFFRANVAYQTHTTQCHQCWPDRSWIDEGGCVNKNSVERSFGCWPLPSISTMDFVCVSREKKLVYPSGSVIIAFLTTEFAW